MKSKLNKTICGSAVTALKRCIMNSKKILDLVGKIEKLIPSNDSSSREELKAGLKILIEDYLHSLNLVTREEFDIQKKVLIKTRLKIEELEEKLKD